MMYDDDITIWFTQGMNWRLHLLYRSYSLKTNPLYYVSKPISFTLYYLVMQVNKDDSDWPQL